MGAVAGKIMIRPMGEYDPSTVYDILDLVKYDNKPWLCKKSNIMGVTPVEGEYWMNVIDVTIANADTLDGHDSDYFATSEGLNRLSVEIGELSDKNARVINMTLTASGWSSEAPYTQIVVVNGITANDAPIPMFVDDGANEADSKAKTKAYGCVTYFDSGDDSITVTCKYKKPEVDFTVALKGV